jgi:hypothetical protein
MLLRWMIDAGKTVSGESSIPQNLPILELITFAQTQLLFFLAAPLIISQELPQEKAASLEALS